LSLGFGRRAGSHLGKEAAQVGLAVEARLVRVKVRLRLGVGVRLRLGLGLGFVLVLVLVLARYPAKAEARGGLFNFS